MLTVNLHGSCVTRDVLEIFKGEKIQLLKYIARSSIFSIQSSPLKYEISNNILGNWGQDCLKADFNKSIFDLFRSNKSDFLLIDLIDERFGLLECQKNEEITLITDSSILHESGIYNSLISDYQCKKINSIKFSDEVINNTIKSYAENIKRIYSTDKIIINECYAVYQYLSSDGSVCDFDEHNLNVAQIINKKISKYYSILEKELDGCNVIKMPQNIYASESNKWGLAPFHFNDEYYNATLESMFEIMKIH